MKKIFEEMKQVEWLSGRRLMIDTTYVLVFSGVLLVYFTIVDKGLSELIKYIIS